MKKNNYLNSMHFKTWSYFAIFALSILLIWEFGQIIFLKPLYMATQKRAIHQMTDNIIEIYSDQRSFESKNADLYSMTIERNACVLIYDRTNNTSQVFDALGEEGCMIYSSQNINQKIINDITSDENDEIFIKENLHDIYNRDVYIYSKRNLNENGELYFISNFVLQPINEISETIQHLFFYITLIVLILSLIISYFLSQLISKPIRKITDEASQFAQGNYNISFDTENEINELSQLSETLNIMTNEINTIEETRKEMFANVSHDLKTPLTMIKAYAEMIRDLSGDNPEKRNQHLEVILKETDNLNYLVSDILSLSKAQSFASNMEIVPYDFSSQIASNIEKFNDVAKKEGVEIIGDYEPELIVAADEKRINEVLYNFISNALKHYGTDKKIIIKAYLLNKKTIRVEIIDHGEGISEEEITFIWDRYYKNDRKYQRSASGTGLGLAINKAILEEHGFHYGVDSKKGKGACFWFEMNSANVE